VTLKTNCRDRTGSAPKSTVSFFRTEFCLRDMSGFSFVGSSLIAKSPLAGIVRHIYYSASDRRERIGPTFAALEITEILSRGQVGQLAGHFLRLGQIPDRHQVLGSTIGMSHEYVEHDSIKGNRNTKELLPAHQNECLCKQLKQWRLKRG
jgi:hypothetical protein